MKCLYIHRGSFKNVPLPVLVSEKAKSEALESKQLSSDSECPIEKVAGFCDVTGLTGPACLFSRFLCLGNQSVPFFPTAIKYQRPTNSATSRQYPRISLVSLLAIFW